MRSQVLLGLMEKPKDKYLTKALRELDEAIVSMGGRAPKT